MSGVAGSVAVTTEKPSDFEALGPLDGGALTRFPPDAFAVVRVSGELRGRAALYWSKCPDLDGRRTGLVGHFASRDAGATSDLLVGACTALREQGARLAIGPMNGSTWEKYRFTTWSDGSPPFFLEPENPAEWPLQWEGAGFSILARYVTTERRDLEEYEWARAKHLPRLIGRGLRFHPVEPGNFERALHRVYPLVRDAFVKNFLYTPLELDEFLALYRPATALVDPRFCRLAEMDGEIVGFVYAYLDPLDLARHGRSTTLVLKTLAARSGMRTALTGGMLAAEIDRAAKEAGVERIVNALMHESAGSMKLTSPYGRIIRRYALYARDLQG